MEYITHRPFHGVTEAGRLLEIPVSTVLPVLGERIAKDNASVCTVRSHIAYKFFARNDDGMGMERGKLTYAIAYAPRVRLHKDGHVFRFSEDEAALLNEKYKHFLKPVDTIIFNHDFFNADVDELTNMAEDLGIQKEE